MKIGLIDVDGHHYPNLALMKISAWHKAKGDTVEWWWSDLIHYDVVYMSKVFSDTYTPDQPEPLNADQVIKGGTGYAITMDHGLEVYHPERDRPLPPEIEHIYPNYSLYPELTKGTAYGFLTRGCPRGCGFCHVGGKEGRASVKVADLSEFWRGQKNVVVMDPNILACPERRDLLERLVASRAYQSNLPQKTGAGNMKLLLGGSPCTHWSIAQTKNRETKPEGLGWELFLNYLIALEKYQPRYFLYENNKSMAPAIRAQITAELGVEPILINSALVSAQNRQRLYWTNIPGVEQPEDLGILLRDILESSVCWNEKAYTLKASIGQHGGTSSVLKTMKEPGKFPFNGVAEPVRIGTIESDAKNADFDSQQYRVYSPDGKSVTLCGQGGGVWAKTGLYAALVRVGDMPNAEGEIKGGQAHRVYDADGKAVTLTARPNGGGVDGPLYAYRPGEKGEKAYPVYEVRDGKITIKGEKYPIKLADGFYIIRKLTVRECMRLQTVPEEYIFPVSDTQAYKMLGNGWTVDVIAHILSYAPGISSIPLEVLPMYDGMSCGRLALNKLGAHVRRYYATEIDKYAIKTTQANFPDTVQLGDAFRVREADWRLEGRRRTVEDPPVQLEINFAGRQLWK